MAHIYVHDEVARLLQQEIDFKKAARKLRKIQIEEKCSEKDAWSIYYNNFENTPLLHYGPHLDIIASKSSKDTDEVYNSLCDLFDEVFTNLLEEELKNIKLTIEEN